ncbi:hypothetical protein MTO96_046780 [Rhipicephalus appendiculatus]
MSSVRRQSFTAQQKLKIIAEEFAKRDVDESCVQLWRKKKDSLQAAHGDRRSFRGPKTYPELEVVHRRSRGHAVSTAQVEARMAAPLYEAARALDQTADNNMSTLAGFLRGEAAAQVPEICNSPEKAARLHFLPNRQCG